MSNESGDALVVGIGASAGGLQALEDFFRDMPAKPGMAFVVVQHLSPNYKSLMVELMSRCTALEVCRVEDQMELRENVIHLIPPKVFIRVEGRTLRLDDQEEPRGISLPIDVFFRSMATEFQDRAVGIVLSGTGSDGTLGIRAIKGAGGLVMVQKPESAKFDGMPRSALQTRMVDFVLDPDGLREKLLQYADYPLLATGDVASPTMSSLQKVLEVLRSATDVDFTQYRISTLSRRVERRMQLNQIADLETYLHVLRQDQAEVQALYKDSLIGVTRFFRDPDAYDELRGRLREELTEHPEGEDFRVWCVACSTGEEPYSIAILINELAEEMKLSVRLKLFATDIDRAALRTASVGAYPESIAADVPKAYLERYFKRTQGTYTVTESLRKQVIFSFHNVLADPPFNRLNLASLRNMLIYLEVEAQQRVLRNLSFGLHPEGVLFLGPSETVGDLIGDFLTLNNRWKVYKRRPVARSRMPNHLPLTSRVHEAKTTSPAFSLPVHPSRTAVAERDVFRHLMSRHAPATLVVDDGHRVLMAFGAVHEYVHIPIGTMTADLQAMADGNLAVVIASAIHRAREEGKSVRYQRVDVAKEPAPPNLVDVVVDPLPTGAANNSLFAIVLRPSGAQHTEETLEPVDLPPTQHLRDLQEELQYTRESHQATIEELETSNEELQATNEELLSSNEELQSTNEELQSVNEELVTVNAEYQSKIDELQQLNADMDNFFMNSGTGTLFLDSQLRIRKFSPTVAQHFSLVDNDLNRPLSHFSFGLQYPEFFKDARSVLETLEPVGKEVVGDGGRWYLVKIAPYRREGQPVSGVVVTFIDVTEKHRARRTIEVYEKELAELREDPSARRRVLVVEDDPDHRALMATELRHFEFVADILEVATVEDAKTVIRKGRDFDIAFVDIGLPDGDGFEVLRAIREHDAQAHVPVVLLSASDDAESVNKAYELGASCFVHKPVSIRELGTVMRRVSLYWFTVVKGPTHG